MTNPVDALVLDLLEWIGKEPRAYAEVIEAWRTSCPRLPVWEEANERGFIDHAFDPIQGKTVSVSTVGLKVIEIARPARVNAVASYQRAHGGEYPCGTVPTHAGGHGSVPTRPSAG